MRQQMVLLAIILVATVGTAMGRDWTDTTGKFHTEARLLQCCNDTAWLEKPNGRLILVPLAKLSEPDRAYVIREFPTQGATKIQSTAATAEKAVAKSAAPAKAPSALQRVRAQATIHFASHARQQEELPEAMPEDEESTEEVPQPQPQPSQDKYIYSGRCGTFHLIGELGTGAYWYQGKHYLAMLHKAGEDDNYLYYDSNHPDGQIIQWYFSKTERCCKFWVWKRTGMTTQGHYEREYRTKPN